MYKQCRTEQSAARQRQLEQKLLQVMLHRQYDEISVMELCEAMGIPRKSFYRYFSSKEGALCALIDHTLMEYDDSVIYSREQLGLLPQKYMEQAFQFWIEHRELLDAMARSNLYGVLVLRTITYTRETDSMPPFMTSEDRFLRDYATMFAVSGLMSLIVWWHRDGFSKSAQEMAKLALRLFTEPLFDLKIN